MNIWDLTPGTAIRLVKSFRDCHGGEFQAGTVLHFDHSDYLPYHGGHTVFFQEALMYLCDLDDTSAVVENVNHEYFVPAGENE